MRGGEVLCTSKSVFNISTDLARKDVKFGNTNVFGKETGFVQLRIKNAKANKSGKPELVDIYESNSDTCPVKALKKFWNATKSASDDWPLFCDTKGSPFTMRELNKHLKVILGPHLKGLGVISCHSLRSGLVSMLAKQGHSEETLKQIGRWSSRAFMAYVKLGKTNRVQIAKIYRNLEQ